MKSQPVQENYKDIVVSKNNFTSPKTESIMKVIQQKIEGLRDCFEVTWSLWSFVEKEKQQLLFKAPKTPLNPDKNQRYSGKNQHMFK